MSARTCARWPRGCWRGSSPPWLLGPRPQRGRQWPRIGAQAAQERARRRLRRPAVAARLPPTTIASELWTGNGPIRIRQRSPTSYTPFPGARGAEIRSEKYAMQLSAAPQARHGKTAAAIEPRAWPARAFNCCYNLNPLATLGRTPHRSERLALAAPLECPPIVTTALHTRRRVGVCYLPGGVIIRSGR